ncbi:MAG: DUF1565 domain-containing protein [Alphaproteobacteria bacterium]|nr:DUF1565 domain-containing protein [Alphaproteobacteria bacterium]
MRWIAGTSAVIVMGCGPSTPQMAGCPKPDGVVTEGLAAAIDGAAPGAVLWIRPGTYEAVLVDKPVTLVGTDASGACAPVVGEGGPRLAGLTLTPEAGGSAVSGVVVDGPLTVAASEAVVSDLFVPPTGGPVTVGAEATLVRFVVAAQTDPAVSVTASATVSDGMILRSPGTALDVSGPARLAFLTIAGHVGDGVVLSGGGQVLSDSILVGAEAAEPPQEDGPVGLREHAPARRLESLSFGAHRGYHYARDGMAPIGRSPRTDRMAEVLLPGDRTAFALPLVTDGVARADFLDTLRTPIWSGVVDDEASGQAWVAAYTPTSPMPAARLDAWPDLVPVYGSATDVRGAPRPADARVGAVETSDTAWAFDAAPVVVSTDGDDAAAGTPEAPLRTIGAGIARSAPGQPVWVVTGTYAEPVYVIDRPVVLQGVKRGAGALVPIETADDPDAPVIDPSTTGEPQHALYLENVGKASVVRGVALRNAYTGLVVIGTGRDAPAEPRIEAVSFAGHRKGIDGDQGAGTATGCLFRDNEVAISLRSIAGWTVQDSVFHDNGLSLTLSYTQAEGGHDLTFQRNRFDHDGGLALDVVSARDGQRLLFRDNTFVATTLFVHAGLGTAPVDVVGNHFEDDARLVVDEAAWAVPHLHVADNTPASLAIELSGPGWASATARQPFDHLPGPVVPAVTDWTDAERQVQPYASPVVRGDDGRVWAVAADFDGVAVFDAQGARLGFVPTGRDPRTVALTPDGALALVANLGAGTVSFVDTATLEVVRDVEVGLEPFGVVVDTAGTSAYVSLSGGEGIVRLAVPSGRVTGEVGGLPAEPRGLALWGGPGDGKLFITHFVPEHRPAEVPSSLDAHQAVLSVVDLPDFADARTIALPVVDSPRFPPAVPVLMQAAVVRGDRVYLPSFGANTDRPLGTVLRGRRLQEFEVTSQGLLTVVDAVDEVAIPEESANLSTPGNPINGPYQLGFVPGTDTAWVVSYGNDAVARWQVRRGAPPLALDGYRQSVGILVGGNPRGVALSADGDRLYTDNFATGDLSTVDLTRGAEVQRTPLGPADADRLTPLGRRGKHLFYTTTLVATSANFWFTCATCHPDGRNDGVTWAFTYGPRSTTPLASALETLPLHFDADRDEVDDFEHTVRDLQGGFSLAQGRVDAELGAPLSAQDTPWAAIRAYLTDGVDAPRAQATDLSPRGRAVFRRMGCTACHGGPAFTTSRLVQGGPRAGRQLTATLRDVGTKTDRDLLGTGGFDPPSLWGVGKTAPYLHDGSALTLRDVLANGKHLLAGAVGTPEGLSALDEEALVAFLQGITRGTAPVDDPLAPGEVHALLPEALDRAGVLVAWGTDRYTTDTPVHVVLTTADVGDPLSAGVGTAHPVAGTEAAFDVAPGEVLEVTGVGQPYRLAVTPGE